MRRTKLNTSIIYTDVYAKMVESIIENGVSMRNFKISIDKFNIRKVKKTNKFKNTMDITYKVYQKKPPMTRVTSNTIVRFEGKGDIPYEVRIQFGILALITDDQIDILKEYTYALTKAYLEKDAFLATLYPRDLKYPDSLLDIDTIDIDDEEPSFAQVDSANKRRSMEILVHKDSGKTYEDMEFTDEDEETFQRMIKSYNSMESEF